MKVYIVFRDVPYEFGEIQGVYSNKEAANEHLENIGQTDDEYDIQEWDVEDTFKKEAVGRRDYYQINSYGSMSGYYWSVWKEAVSTEDAELIDDGSSEKSLEDTREHILGSYPQAIKDRNSL